MRFSVFLTLFVATFIACTSFTSADNARHLKGSELTAGSEERGVGNFALLDDATKKLTADKFVAKAVQNFKLSAGKTTELTAKQETKIVKMVKAAAKQNVPWSKTKKIIVGVAGTAASLATLYILYKTFQTGGGTATTTV
ncbi:uncharacterized protein KRP23_12187 [Phytophthora ramorum]|uniref:RxLR effector protein n=1 Tax=Phytophthora ramorum TaxID=164328 RepID=H3GSX7_PHYRM|nr:hypothetical protein KRP23_12187 [Phytophthora ramorum]